MDVEIIENVFLTSGVIMVLSWLLTPAVVTEGEEVISIGEYLFLWVITLSTVTSIVAAAVLIWIQ